MFETTSHIDEQIISHFMESGTITPQHIDIAHEEKKLSHGNMCQLLIELGFLTLHDVQLAYANVMGYPLINPDSFSNVEFVDDIFYAIQSDKIHIGMKDPTPFTKR